MHYTQITPQIWTIDHFLTPQECEEMILFSEYKGYHEATVSLTAGAKMMKHIRDNDRVVYDDTVLATTLWETLQPYCPQHIEGEEAIGLNERFRWYRYQEGQQFKRHIDGSVVLKEHQLKSRITFLVYLNDDYEGGYTTFDTVEIVPKKGTALLFIHEQKHQSTPIHKGTKYVLRSDVMYTNNNK